MEIRKPEAAEEEGFSLESFQAQVEESLQSFDTAVVETFVVENINEDAAMGSIEATVSEIEVLDTDSPTFAPTPAPTGVPTSSPTEEPTIEDPTEEPTTEEPTTEEPTTEEPTTEEPTEENPCDCASTCETQPEDCAGLHELTIEGGCANSCLDTSGLLEACVQPHYDRLECTEDDFVLEVSDFEGPVDAPSGGSQVAPSQLLKIWAVYGACVALFSMLSNGAAVY